MSKMAFLHSRSGKQLPHRQQKCVILEHFESTEGTWHLIPVLFGLGMRSHPCSSSLPHCSPQPACPVGHKPPHAVLRPLGKVQAGRAAADPPSIWWIFAWTPHPPWPWASLTITLWQQPFSPSFSKAAFKPYLLKKIILKSLRRVLTSFLCYSFTWL